MSLLHPRDAHFGDFAAHVRDTLDARKRAEEWQRQLDAEDEELDKIEHVLIPRHKKLIKHANTVVDVHGETAPYLSILNLAENITWVANVTTTPWVEDEAQRDAQSDVRVSYRLVRGRVRHVHASDALVLERNISAPDPSDTAKRIEKDFTVVSLNVNVLYGGENISVADKGICADAPDVSHLFSDMPPALDAEDDDFEAVRDMIDLIDLSLSK